MEETLTEEEQTALTLITAYIESPNQKDLFSPGPFKLICVLSYSLKVPLHRAAANAFRYEINKDSTITLQSNVLRCLLYLLISRDIFTLDIVTTMLGYLTYNEKNVDTLVQEGGLPLLVNLMSSKSKSITSNVSGCLANISSSKEVFKTLLLSLDSLPVLLNLAKSEERFNRRNSLSTMANLSSLAQVRKSLSAMNIIELINEFFYSEDSMVIYISLVLLTNLVLEGLPKEKVLSQTLSIISSLLQHSVEGIKLKSVSVIRNLSLNGSTHPYIISSGVITPLAINLQTTDLKLLHETLACFKNLATSRNTAHILCKRSLPCYHFCYQLLQVLKVICDKKNMTKLTSLLLEDVLGLLKNLSLNLMSFGKIYFERTTLFTEIEDGLLATIACYLISSEAEGEVSILAINEWGTILSLLSESGNQRLLRSCSDYICIWTAVHFISHYKDENLRTSLLCFLVMIIKEGCDLNCITKDVDFPLLLMELLTSSNHVFVVTSLWIVYHLSTKGSTIQFDLKLLTELKLDPCELKAFNSIHIKRMTYLLKILCRNWQLQDINTIISYLQKELRILIQS